MDQLRVLWKWLASWRKREWGARDYPLRYREQSPDPALDTTRVTFPRWSLQIINWWQMGGLGETQEEAFTDLETRLAARRQDGSPLPRPGRGLPLTFASSTIIEDHEDIAREVVSQILELNYDECFISDESSLHDFTSSKAEASELAARIERHFKVKLPDTSGFLLANICRAIGDSRGAA